MKIIDNAIALRILYLLVLPFTKQRAYKLGLIDENGDAKLPIAQMTKEQQANYTALHRLCFRLKKILAMIPFGKTTIASMAAAYALVRESNESGKELDETALEEAFKEKLSKSDTLFESSIEEHELLMMFTIMEKLSDEILSEDGAAAPVTTTAGIQTNKVIIKNSEFKNMKRKNTAGRKVWVKENLNLDSAIVIDDESGEFMYVK